MNESTLKIPLNKSDHTRGPLSATVHLVEYGDYQCPHCLAAFPILDELVNNYQFDLCFAFRHFPLTTIHPLAGVAAMAAEAAGVQGEFWEMHEALYSNQEYLSYNAILFIARELELDMKMFENDLESAELSEKVQNHFNSGIRSGVNATPGIFINGLRYEGTVSYEDLNLAIQEIINENRVAI